MVSSGSILLRGVKIVLRARFVTPRFVFDV
jgi:hypothetical protein